MYDFICKCLRAPFTQKKMPRRSSNASPARRVRPCLEVLEDRLVPAATYLQTNLISDVPGMAQVTDSNLQNSWGVAESATGPFWVSDQGSNVATVYSVTSSGVSKVPLTVSIPTTAVGPQGPTGLVSNSTSSFDLLNGQPAHFIFANLNGTISAWNSGGSAAIEATTPGGLYTGLAIGSNAQGNFLYAADISKGTIDVFDSSFTPVTLGQGGFGTFTDPLLPSDLKLAPFNVQNINGELYVTYAPPQRADRTMATPGEGAVAIFDTNGNFIRQLTAGGPLASPWGMVIAPSTFGQFGGDLLVGNFAFNFSDINAYDPATGQFLGTLSGVNGQPLLNPGLWALTFGNGANGGSPNTLYFSAGIDSEQEGLFGAIQAFPTLTTPTTPLAHLAFSIFVAVDQGIGNFFQTFDASLLSFESRLTAINSSLSSFFTTLDGNLDALKTSILLGLEAAEDGVIATLNRLTAGGSTPGSQPVGSPPVYSP